MIFAKKRVWKIKYSIGHFLRRVMLDVLSTPPQNESNAFTVYRLIMLTAMYPPTAHFKPVQSLILYHLHNLLPSWIFLKLS